MSAISDATVDLETYVQLLKDIINGPPTGPGSTVDLPLGGTQDTVAKALSLIDQVTLIGLLDAHTTDTGNPHNVTPAQIGAALAGDHTALVGIVAALDLVVTANTAANVATQAQLDAHIAATTSGMHTLGQHFEAGTRCFSHSRHNGAGMAFAVLDGQLSFWGEREVVGCLPLPVANTSIGSVREAAYIQANDFPHPDFTPELHLTDHIKDVAFADQDGGIARSMGGIIYVWHAGVAVYSRIAGQNPTANEREVAIPVFFDDGGGNNVPIDEFDLATYLGTGATALFVDENRELWICTANFGDMTYDIGLAASGTMAPQKIAPAKFASGVRKARCWHGGVVVLLENDELWGAGTNESGELGQGDILDKLDFVLIQSNITDFEVNLDQTAANQAIMCINTSDELKGIGHAADSWMGGSSTVDAQSPRLIATDVKNAWFAGAGGMVLVFEGNDGTWWRCGNNTRGVYGDGTITTSQDVVSHPEIEALITTHGAIQEIIIGAHLAAAPSNCWIRFANNVIYATGENTLGQLGIGTAIDTNDFTRCIIQLKDGENVVEMSHVIGPALDPHIILLTDLGRVLQAGDGNFGFSMGREQVAEGDRRVFEAINLL